MTEQEKAGPIYVASAAGASPALTEAITLLSKAKDRVADHAEGWVYLTDDGEHFTCPTPADETIVDVCLNDGSVCLSWYSCNIQEAGDYDFLPVKDGEPEMEAESIADKVVAWRKRT